VNLPPGGVTSKVPPLVITQKEDVIRPVGTDEIVHTPASNAPQEDPEVIVTTVPAAPEALESVREGTAPTTIEPAPVDAVTPGGFESVTISAKVEPAKAVDATE